MKRFLSIGLVVVLAAFLTAAVLYAFANKAQENPKSQTEKVTASVPDAAIQGSEQHPCAGGSAACQAKHASGECKGHQPGEEHSENHSK